MSSYYIRVRQVFHPDIIFKVVNEAIESELLFVPMNDLMFLKLIINLGQPLELLITLI